MDATHLIFPAFFAGLITFLAPCTLPLLPGYLGFISGVSLSQLKNKKTVSHYRGKIFTNALAYVLGFSGIFIFFGLLFGFLGIQFGWIRAVITRFGGIILIIWGFAILGMFRLPLFLSRFKVTLPSKYIRPATPWSAFLLGATISLGWSPCIGPILGSVLFLATSTGTVVQGALLLAMFSFGLSFPFLIVAGAFAYFTRYYSKISAILRMLSVVGGLFLIIFGFLFLTMSIPTWSSFFYQLFGFLRYDELLLYL